jgi:ATP sulfurylase
LNSAVNLAEQEAEGEVETAQAEVHTHETILSGFFTELEGFQNMGKAEVYAVIQRWHGKYKAL